MCVCVCVCVCVCACVFRQFPTISTSEVIASAIRVDTVTALVTRIPRVLIILTFIQGHADLNHEIKKYLISSETVICCEDSAG